MTIKVKIANILNKSNQRSKRAALNSGTTKYFMKFYGRRAKAPQKLQITKTKINDVVTVDSRYE